MWGFFSSWCVDAGQSFPGADARSSLPLVVKPQPTPFRYKHGAPSVLFSGKCRQYAALPARRKAPRDPCKPACSTCKVICTTNRGDCTACKATCRRTGRRCTARRVAGRRTGRRCTARKVACTRTGRRCTTREVVCRRTGRGRTTCEVVCRRTGRGRTTREVVCRRTGRGRTTCQVVCTRAGRGRTTCGPRRRHGITPGPSRAASAARGAWPWPPALARGSPPAASPPAPA